MRSSSTLLLLFCSLSASAQWSTYSTLGAAQSSGENCIELTSTGQSGSVWANEALDLTQPFHIQAKLNFGSVNHGAEGVVLVFHEEGSQNGAVAFEDFETSFGVEFDTRYQSEHGDLEVDHIAMITDGSLTHTNSGGTSTAGPVAAFLNEQELEDGNEHLVDVIWDPSGPEMSIQLDCEERLVASIDLIDDVFNGNQFVNWGFAAAGDNAVNIPHVCLEGNATGTDVEIYACPEAAVQLVAGGLDATDYMWTPNNAVSDPTLQSPMYTGVMGNNLSVTYTNQCGESVTEEVEIIIDEVHVDILSEGSALNCFNEGSLVCEASSSFGTYLDYAWYLNNEFIGDDMSVQMTSQGSLNLEVRYPGTTSLMCEDEFNMQVVIDTTHFYVDAGLPGTITCTNSSVELLGTASNHPSAEVLWSTTDGALDGPSQSTHSLASAGGNYTLMVTNTDNGCMSMDSVTIFEDITIPQVSVGEIFQDIHCDHPVVTLEGTTVSPQEYTPLYSWISASSGDVVSSELEPDFDEPGRYTLHVEFLENGCTTTLKQAALVEASDDVLDLSQLVLPNVITPDNNGSNDHFAPFVPGQEEVNVMRMMDEYHIQVFNRWGTLLFENDGQPLQWDGRANGSIVHAGTYVVHVSYLSTCTTEQTGQMRTMLEVIR